MHVLDQAVGEDRRREILRAAGIAEPPDGTAMIPEEVAARLHRQLRLALPERAAELAARAGMATGDYLLAHRIPKPAQVLLKLLPMRSAAGLLCRAIARNAWTFVGSGQFRVVDPFTFEITRNPLIADERSATCLCAWHESVFTRLYQELVAPGLECREVSCGAQGPGIPCRFELR